MIAGGIFFILGVLGLVLPLLPTTPFILLAALCWAKGSEKFHTWLLNHHYFGSMLSDWESHRVIPLKAKWLSTIMMNGMILLSAFYLVSSPWWAKLLMIASSITVSIWIWSFPNSVEESERIVQK